MMEQKSVIFEAQGFQTYADVFVFLSEMQVPQLSALHSLQFDFSYSFEFLRM